MKKNNPNKPVKNLFKNEISNFFNFKNNEQDTIDDINKSIDKIIKTKEPKKTQIVKEEDIEKLETHFYKLKCEVLFKKRQFNLSEKFYQQINEGKIHNIFKDANEVYIIVNLVLKFINSLYSLKNHNFLRKN